MAQDTSASSPPPSEPPSPTRALENTLNAIGDEPEALLAFIAEAAAAETAETLCALARLKLGRVYFGDGFYDAAQPQFEACITTLENSPDHADKCGIALCSLSGVYLKKGETERAEELLERAKAHAASDRSRNPATDEPPPTPPTKRGGCCPFSAAYSFSSPSPLSDSPPPTCSGRHFRRLPRA